MRNLVTIVKILLAVAIALAGRTLRRIVRGPIVPSWTWSMEMLVVGFRALIMASSRNGDRTERRSLEARLDPPLPKALRNTIDVTEGSVGQVAGEWHRRIDTPDGATILYLHGGGYISGNPATHRRMVARLTAETATQSFVADYRIAPAHPYPAALDDAMAAYVGLLETGTSPDSLVVAGDSAGGGLAAALLLRLRDEGLPGPAGAVLFSPYTDLEHRAASIRRNWRTDYLPIWDGSPNYFYIGDGDPKDPYISPIHGRFSGIAPMLIFAGGREMILDDAVGLAEAARQDGVDVELVIEPDMFHVWPALLPDHEASIRAMTRTSSFIAEVCEPAPVTPQNR